MRTHEKSGLCGCILRALCGVLAFVDAVTAFVVVGASHLYNQNCDSDDSLESDELSDKVRDAVGMGVGEVAAAADGAAVAFFAGRASGPLAFDDVDFIVTNVQSRKFNFRDL